MMTKEYGVCIVFSSSYMSDNIHIVRSLVDEGFSMLRPHVGIDYVEYFVYDKAYEIEDMAKVMKPIVDRYSHYIESVHYFTMEMYNMKGYMK